MKTYLDLVETVLTQGSPRQDRTGVGTLSVFGLQCRYDLRQGFPLVTTKKVNYTSVVAELLWFLKGATNIHQGLSDKTPIWNAWADENGNLGPIYGYQWRHWEKFIPDPEHPETYQKTFVDQIQQLLNDLRWNPFSRRLIVTAWNPADIEKMALPPCHAFFQVYVQEGRLDLQLYQRSADVALGVPYNIASYATLMHMLCGSCGYTPGYFIHTLGDAHIYQNHIQGLKEQLTRPPKPLPRLTVAEKDFWDLQLEDFILEGYQHHPFIFFPIAV